MEGGYKNTGNSFWSPRYKAWARNLCSDKGKIVVKLDIKNRKDRTLHLSSSENKTWKGAGHLRGIYYCKDLSDRDTRFDPTPDLVLTPSSLSVSEGGSGSYTVALAGPPSAAVTVTIRSGSGVKVDTDADTNGNQNTLSFPTVNWNTPQTVVVRGEQDDDAVDETVTLSHRASGGDYGSVTADLSVTVRDDDKADAALLLTPASLVLAKGGSGSYTVALASQPTDRVTVTISSGSSVTLDTDAATNGNQNTLSFSTANWNTPQTVVVSSEQDNATVDEAVTLSHSASGGDYGSVTANLSVTFQNICERMDALNSNGTICRLFSKGITSLSSNDFDGLSNLDRLYLNNNNLNSLPEDVFAGLSNLQMLTLNNNNLSNLPEDIFAGLSNLQHLHLNNNDLSGLPENIFDDLSNLQELGLYENNLSSLPEDIFAGLSNLQELNLYENNLSTLPEDVFSGPANLQELSLYENNLSSLPEDVFSGLSKLRYLYLYNNDLSSLPEDIFDGLSNLDILELSGNSLICLPSLPLSAPIDVALPLCGSLLTLTPSSLTVLEGSSGSYTVALGSRPTDTVAITISSGSGVVTVDTDPVSNGNQNTLTFTTANWSTAQTVQVGGRKDNDTVDDTVTLSHTGSGGGYGSVTADLKVTVTDTTALLLTPASLAVAEGGGRTYTVALASQPTDTVTVTIMSGSGVTVDADTATNGNQNTLSFTTTNWSTPQTVDVNGDQDDDVIDETVTLAHTASGGGYGSATASLGVTVIDADKEPALTLTPSSLTVLAGSSGSYTVALASKPTAAVTVSLSSGSGVTVDTDADTNGNQTNLSFTTANWSNPQTVEVSVDQDVDNTATLSHTASGGGYGLVTASLSVHVQNICERINPLSFDGETCDLSSKEITSLSSGDFAELSSLKKLYLSENQLSSLPENIFAGLSNLDRLSLNRNNLSSLPEDIFNGLSNVYWLRLENNNLSNLPEDIFDELFSLVHLNLSKNDLINSLPEDIFAELSNLQNLRLDNNDLSSLSEDIFAGLSKLQYLYLSDNNLSSLPEDIFAGLSKVKFLFLEDNDLNSLPEDIFAELSSLKTLKLNDNNLSNLPEDIFVGLSALEKLSLDGNSLTCLPKSLPLSVDVDVDLPQCGNTNTTAALPSWLTADGTLEPLTLYVGGEDGSRDVSTAFSVDNDKAGDITWHFASSHPAVASVEPESSGSSMVMVTPVREGKATITVTATAANGNGISDSASLSFLVTVVTSPAEETAIRSALSGQGRVVLGSVTDMIGKRFDSGTGGTGASGSVCLNSAAGADGESATSDESGSSSGNAIAGSYGSHGDSSDHLIASDIWQGENWNTDLAATGLRGVPHVSHRDENSMDKTFDDLLELFRGQPHSLHPADWIGQCGSGTVGEVSRPWTLWAGTDLQWARGGTETSDFDGEWQLYYVGADRAFREQWLAGLSLSQVQGEVDYSFEDATVAGAGQLSSNLTAIYPYLHGQLSSNLELWAIGGIGFGEVENEREHVDGDADQADLHMRLLSLGLRRSLSRAGSAMDLALSSDAGFLNLSAEGDGSLDGAEASIGRFRLGLELSRPFASGVEPFAQLHGRYDSGDGPTGAAGEVVLGLRYGDERFNLELRGNHLISAAELEQWGAKAWLDYSPATNGTGLNLALNSQWGAAENGDSFLDGHTMKLPTPALVSAQSDGDSLPVEISGEIGYSLSMGQQWGILTPNLGYDHSDNGSSRSRVGLAYAFSSDLDRDIELRLDLARRERRQEDPDHSIELGAELRF